LASGMGEVVCGKALVNDGLPQHQVVKLHDAGLTVVRSHAFDCDEPMVAWAVRLHSNFDCLILCTGDKHFRPLMELLQEAGRKVIVCAVNGSCSARLKALCDQYVEMPVVSHVSHKPRRFAPGRNLPPASIGLTRSDENSIPALVIASI